MKLIDADKGYEVLDKLFAKIQKNNFVTTQDMLDEAWKEWCSLPIAYDVHKVVEQMEKNREEILSDTSYDNEIINHFLEYVDQMMEAVEEGT